MQQADTHRIEKIDPNLPEVARLISLSDAYLAELYPAESNHLASIEDLQKPNAALFGCYIGDELVGCGAVRVMSDDGLYGEVKRLFVDERQRGKGLSSAILQRLEAHLQEQGVALARLEVGISQPEALGLYTRYGYQTRPPFGYYREDPYSIFMQKQLVD
ncbi:GNAT family N-acetyltransferase [Nitrincola alkalilacustris]|uniref:GNAT family N-acetyltransferase n=1 Tax=Nitrincola alkalilacustris TaxID=1571224 RepID=UPI00124D5F21|nr:GNAT family N-acetyltransferase [Nitrincola alkalilacustris]